MDYMSPSGPPRVLLEKLGLDGHDLDRTGFIAIFRSENLGRDRVGSHYRNKFPLKLRAWL